MLRAPDPEREARDWPQDAIEDDDNGAYWHQCVVCVKEFTGHKRRLVCRACTEAHHKAKRGTGRTTRMLRLAIKAAKHGKVLVVGASSRHCNLLKITAGAIVHEEGFPERRLDNIDFAPIESTTAMHGREGPIFHDHYALESLSERRARGPKPQ